MRVLIGILRYPPDFTGAGLKIHEIYKRLAKKGIKNVYVITSKDKWDKKIDFFNQIEVHYVSEYTLNKKFNNRFFKLWTVFVGSSRALIQYYKLYQKIDIVHTVGSGWLPIIVSWCAFFTRKPVVREIVLLGVDDPIALKRSKSLLARYIFLLPFNFAKLIIAISPPLKESCIAYGLSGDKVWFRFSPVYLAELSEEDLVKTNVVGIDFNIKTILWVGVIGKRKNPQFLVKAGYYLKGRVQLLFVGPKAKKEDRYFDELESLANKLKKETIDRVNVVFLGRIVDPKILSFLYKKSNLFWFSSFKEGLAYVVLEALASGLPVITLPVMGIMKHVIVDPNDGEVVDTNDPKCFANIVNKWLYDKKYDKVAISARTRQRISNSEMENKQLEKFKSLIRRF